MEEVLNSSRLCFLVWTVRGDKSATGTRKVSPGCRTAPSASVPHARYRESNASRLRQEIKGMTVTGIVRSGIRSKSSSPAHRSSHSSPTRSTHKENLTPKRRLSEKTISLISTPKTMSESSVSIDQSRNGSENNYIVDTRSKTLNTIDCSSSFKKEKEKEKEKVPLDPSFCSIRPNIASGYGKPLVTPMNKKLSIRREYQVNNTPVAENKVTCQKMSRLRSPTKALRVEKKVIKTASKLPEPIRSRLPTKETTSANAMSRAGSAGSNCRQQPAVRSCSGVKPPKPISSSSMRTKSPTKLADSKESLNKYPQSKVLKQTIKDAMKTAPLRNLSTEKLKQQFCRDTPVFAAGRPNSAIHSNKSFKPQLEDIKSSYLLLNKVNAEPKVKLKEKVDGTQNKPPLPKTPIFDENKRKQELDKAKQRYTSRNFFHDSRYDKIEGLNWISWK